jgi:hypothetical protein
MAVRGDPVLCWALTRTHEFEGGGEFVQHPLYGSALNAQPLRGVPNERSFTVGGIDARDVRELNEHSRAARSAR